ncbi:HNH endonuclease [Sphingobacterium siyangense]|jgi:hypothetical protein|uniref:HNH endonuclease n=1 Tax=Sphingobacterium siyangense TaxID=459529 RepID=UPI003DA24776
MIQANELHKYLKNYSVYPNGEIYSFITKKILKNSLRGEYYCVTLSNNKNKLRISTHRLIAMLFVPNPLNKPCVNHIDGNKLNNNSYNLEWVTHSENEIHSFTVLGKKIIHSDKTKEKIGKANRGNILSAEFRKRLSEIKKNKPAHNRLRVNQYTIDGEFLNTYDSMVSASKAIKGSHSAFSAIKRGRLKTYKGYLWTIEN